MTALFRKTTVPVLNVSVGQVDLMQIIITPQHSQHYASVQSSSVTSTQLNLVKFNDTTSTLWVISRMSFYGSNEPTNRKKDTLQSNQVHPTALTIIQQICSMRKTYTIYAEINASESTHREMGRV